MKAYLKIVVGAIFLGGILAFLYYKDLKEEVIAVTGEAQKVSIFQVGVFKDESNANNYALKYPSAQIYEDEGLYRVIIAVTISNIEKLKEYFKTAGIDYYLKEAIVDKNIVSELQKYDEILSKTDKKEVIDKINLSSTELFKSIYS